MYSGSKRVSGMRFFSAAAFLVLCVSTVNAQNNQTMPIGLLESIMYETYSYVPRDEFHRVVQQFTQANYRGRTSIYQSEMQGFFSSFMLYIHSNGIVAAWEEKYLRRREQSSAAPPAAPVEPEPPPFPATHRLTADTKLYAGQDFNSAAVTTLKRGTEVQLKEYGGYADLNGETAKWAQVSTAEGQSGWVFSGYLGPK